MAAVTDSTLGPRMEHDGPTNPVANSFGIQPGIFLNPAHVLLIVPINEVNSWRNGVHSDITASVQGGFYELVLLDESLSLTKASRGGIELQSGATLAVEPNEAIAIQFQTNGDHSLGYKIVGQNDGSRQVVSFGFSNNSILSAPVQDNSGANLPPGTYTLYVWAHRTSSVNSSRGSMPMYFEFEVPGEVTRTQENIGSVTDLRQPRPVVPAQIINDVPANGGARAAIDRAVHFGYMNAPGGLFNPNARLGWHEAVLIMYRALGMENKETSEVLGVEQFAATGSEMYHAIHWFFLNNPVARATGIPQESALMNRSQIAVHLIRWSSARHLPLPSIYPNLVPNDYNGDVDANGRITSQPVNFMQTMQRAGIMGLFPDGTIRAHGSITRAEMAVILDRVMSLPGFTIHGASEPLSFDLTTAERRIFDAVNSERASRGFAPVVFNEQLSQFARQHSQNLAANNLTGNFGSDGLSVTDRIRNAGLSFAGGAGTRTINLSDNPENIVTFWVHSAGEGIVESHYVSLAVGLAHENGNTRLTLMMAH
jgi:hypothetical protein